MKIIALVDPFTGGHHTAYIRIFSETLINLGYTVWAFVSPEEQLLQWRNEQHPAWTEQNLLVVDYNATTKHFRGFGRFNEAVSMAYRWWHLKKTIRVQEKTRGKKVSSVFFAWLDSYLTGYLVPTLLDTIFPYCWSGLYFHPRHMRLSVTALRATPAQSDVDIVLTAQNCQGIAVHDEGIICHFEQRLHKRVVFFPEIADDTLPNPNNAIAQQIKSQARNRLIVGAIGLSRHQGLLTLLQVAQQANSSRFFFVFVGELDMSQYIEAESTEVKTFFNDLPEHCFSYFGKLKEGEEYNSVFNAIDVPFLVYENFTSASNRLTKAAIFEKPVLAQNKYCIGEDVKKYNLGIVVEEANTFQCLASLENLHRLVKIENMGNTVAGFKSYRDMHSPTVLRQSLEKMVLCKESNIHD